jgi:hypothetical protein
MIVLGEWMKEIYDDEFNFLIRKALEHKKNHSPSKDLLQHLVEQKTLHNGQIKTVADIMQLQQDFPGVHGFLDCSQPETATVTSKGK